MFKPAWTLALCLGAASFPFTGAFSLHPAPATQPSSNLTASPAIQPTNSTPPTTGNSPGSSHKDPNCIAKNLSVETWKELNLDQYLSTYPAGQTINLPQYADSKGEQNFKCGIEEDCNVGQICDPVPAPDWYILLSVQEWNNCMNSVYKAVHFATSVVQGTMALMISELADRNMPPEAWAFDISTLAVLIAALASVLSLGVDLLFLAGYVGILHIFLTWFAGISVISGVLGTSGFALSDLLGQAPPDKRSFVKWGEIGNVFSEWESGMHSKISNTTQTVLNAPISSPDGISSVIKGGAFLYTRQTKSTAELQTEYTTVIQARSLVMVLRSMNAYITRGSDKCDGKGPNGANAGDHVLSFCTSDKIMMNVVLAKGDKTINKINNAKIIAAKFGFTTEYIVMQSWACQSKYGKFQYDPYRDAPLPSDPYQDCVMNLPVCDLTDIRIDKARRGKHHSTTKACRVQGGLPI